MSRVSMSRLSRVVVLAATLGLFGGLLAIGPVVAEGQYGYGPHSGVRGVNILLDTFRYTGVHCAYDNSGDISKITVRAPVIYAAIASGNQRVGWQFIVQAADGSNAGPWNDIFTKPLGHSARTTRTRSGRLNNKSWDVTESHDFYRIQIREYWYTGASTTGIAQNAPYYFSETSSIFAPKVNTRWCLGFISPTSAKASAESSGTQGAVAPSAAVGPAASGNYGVHELIDNQEYPTATCRYSAGHVINRITVRAPVVYGVDRTSNRDHQQVGWRFKVQGYTGSAWVTKYTSGVKKTRANDKGRAATWGAATGKYDFTSGALSYDSYRVQVQIFWYWPSATHVEGSDSLYAQWYLDQDPSQTVVVPQDCASLFS